MSERFAVTQIFLILKKMDYSKIISTLLFINNQMKQQKNSSLYYLPSAN